jgi:membrane associated rhomboid family serine protease
MLPLRDDNPTSRFAFVTFIIIVLNVAAFLLWEPIFKGDQEQQEFFFCHALIPYEVSHTEDLDEGGADAVQAVADQFDVPESQAQQFVREYGQTCDEKVWWQSVFVAMFLHGGWLHIIGNMLFLWVFGNNVEDKLRPIPYFGFYIAGGLAATALQVAIGPDSVIPNLGASGAIAAVLGAYLVMFPRRRVLTLIMFIFITAVYLPAFVVLGLWFVLQLFSGVASLGTDVNVGGGVAFFAHIGGFVFGAVIALLFLPKERLAAAPPPGRPDLWRGRRSRGWWGKREPPPDDWI